jgi:hypothetical protein
LSRKNLILNFERGVGVSLRDFLDAICTLMRKGKLVIIENSGAGSEELHSKF